MMIETILINKITIDQELQQRDVMDADVIDSYAEVYCQGNVEMPPVEVTRDSDDIYWLTDGFHRVAGARMADKESIPAVITDGTRRDAVLSAIQANHKHGLRRTNADKRKAVLTLLMDPEWMEWIDTHIAEMAGVSTHLVGTMRVEQGLFPKERKRKDGTSISVEPKNHSEHRLKKLRNASEEAKARQQEELQQQKEELLGPDEVAVREDLVHQATELNPLQNYSVDELVDEIERRGYILTLEKLEPVETSRNNSKVFQNNSEPLFSTGNSSIEISSARQSLGLSPR